MKGKSIALGVAILAFAFPAAASAQARWTWNSASAQTSLKTHYRTVDPWALEDVQPPSGILGVTPNPRLVAMAKRAAYPTWVWCMGHGPHRGGMYGRFWCLVELRSVMSNYYEPMKAVTLIPTGRYKFRVLNGSR